MFLRKKKFSFEIRFVNLGPRRSPRYDACSEGFPIGSGPRTVARCGRRSQLLRLPYPGSNLSTLPFFPLLKLLASSAIAAPRIGDAAVMYAAQLFAWNPEHQPFALTSKPGKIAHGP